MGGIAASTDVRTYRFARVDDRTRAMTGHVLRYDDFSSSSDARLEEEIVKLLLQYGMPCTFSVVPFACDPGDFLKNGAVTLRPLSRSKANILRPLLDRGLGEVALHGYAHLAFSKIRGEEEFSDRMPYVTQESLLMRGKRHLEDVFNTSVRVFVPPWNRLSSTTARLLKDKGWLLSGGILSSEDRIGSAVPQVPCRTQIADTSAAVRRAARSGQDNLVGTLFHEYDFLESDYPGSRMSLSEFRTHLDDWLAIPHVEHLLMTDAISRHCSDNGERVIKNGLLHEGLQRSRIARWIFSSRAEIYWNVQKARRLGFMIAALP